jgi:hypothetical protein
LAQNMGRWAQAYFTSPPERREQAVQELLRELEAENAAQVPTRDAAPSPMTAQRSELPSGRDSVSEEPAIMRCRACGQSNASSQKFCGMCGARLGDEGTLPDLHRDDAQEEGLNVPELHIANQQMEDELQESRFVPRDHDVYVSKLNTNELSLFQSTRDVDYYDDEDGNEIFSVPRSSGSYRIYVGIVLAMIIGGLAYMAWRSEQLSQNSQVAPLAPPVASKDSTPLGPAPSTAAAPVPSTAAGPAPSTSSAPATPSKPERTPPSETQAASAPAKPAHEEASNSADSTAPALPHGISRPPKADAPDLSGATGSGGTGGEELALAQRYLNGTNGQGRNSAEAAKWLWKAIAKHNAQATLVLSDLYLRGDGVSKNCDQARVLLDTAALKGVKDAGARLRHLQAFGCQ